MIYVTFAHHLFEGAKNWELTQPVTHKSLLENNAWYFAKNIANKVYYEAEAAPSS